MPTLNLISGLLGGIGKSLFSRVLIHIHETEGIPFVAMDADPQTYNVYKYYPHCTEKIEISTSNFKSTDRVFRALETGKTILINLAASSGKAVEDWLKRDDLFTLLEQLAEEDAKTRYSLINWFLSDGSELSLEQFDKTVKFFAPYSSMVTHVLVKNLGKSTEEDWVRLQEKSDLKTVLANPNVQQTELPRFLKPEGFDSMPFTFAQALMKEGNGKNKLNLLDRTRVKKFLSSTQANIAALNLLDPPQPDKTSGNTSKLKLKEQS